MRFGAFANSAEENKAVIFTFQFTFEENITKKNQ